MTILRWPLLQTPYAIVDLETTGLYPGADRVVEVSVVRLAQGEPPVLLFDSLVNPQRRMGATEIHGITEADVRDAPTFAEIAPAVARALSGAVVAAHNAYFDIKFLAEEFGRAGLALTYPYLCTMYLRPLLGLGTRCSLDEACSCYGVRRSLQHTASSDALAAGQLLAHYLGEAERRGLRTFSELAVKQRYKFLESWQHDPVPLSRFSPARPVPRTPRVKSRALAVQRARSQHSPA